MKKYQRMHLIFIRQYIKQIMEYKVDFVDVYKRQVMNLKKQVKISLVGKYVELQDAYISVVEALKHSGYANDAEVKINWVNANDVTAENVAELLGDADGDVYKRQW